MPLKEWTIVYFRNGFAPMDDGQTFGCSVSGMAGTVAVTNDGFIAGTDAASNCSVLNHRLFGEVLSGAYDKVLEDLRNRVAEGFRTDAAIVFFAKAPGMEDFLRQAARVLPGVPFGGGGAARLPGEKSGELLPTAQDVNLLLIRDERFHFTNIWRNVHDETGRRVQFRAGGERVILTLRDENTDAPAQDWYAGERIKAGYPEGSFENIALASPEGWNLHASPEGEFALRTGANLPGGGELDVMLVDSRMASERVGDFCAEENCLIFGCAGLQSMMDAPVQVGLHTLAGFLHGEVLTASGNPRFANLMMSGFILKRNEGNT